MSYSVTPPALSLSGLVDARAPAPTSKETNNTQASPSHSPTLPAAYFVWHSFRYMCALLFDL